MINKCGSVFAAALLCAGLSQANTGSKDERFMADEPISFSQEGGTGLSPYVDGSFDKNSKITMKAIGQEGVVFDLEKTIVTYYLNPRGESAGNSANAQVLGKAQFKSVSGDSHVIQSIFDLNDLNTNILDSVKLGDRISYQVVFAKKGGAGNPVDVEINYTPYAFNKDCVETNKAYFCSPLSVERMNNAPADFPIPSYDGTAKEDGVDWVSMSYVYGDDSSRALLSADVVDPIAFCAGLKLNGQTMTTPTVNDLKYLAEWLALEGKTLSGDYGWPANKNNYISNSKVSHIYDQQVTMYSAVYFGESVGTGDSSINLGDEFSVFDTTHQYVMCKLQK
ncbi:MULTISPECIES: hypothetical protein [Cysteiniphilum]|uniref:hypothetical protein n=1 Tax=Cysteiniphilum TaxID=2056696 RepID=UPI0017849CC3|nr:MULTISPECIES: hypothetical protein [Cysteiniphilum]